MIGLLGTGVWLTVFGMGLVFLLLGLLWAMIRLLVWLDRAVEARAERAVAHPMAAPSAEPIAEPVAIAEAAAPAVELAPGLSSGLLAAITLAVVQHRRVRRRQAAPAMRRHLPSTEHSRWVVTGRTRQHQVWQQGRR